MIQARAEPYSVFYSQELHRETEETFGTLEIKRNRPEYKYSLAINQQDQEILNVLGQKSDNLEKIISKIVQNTCCN